MLLSQNQVELKDSPFSLNGKKLRDYVETRIEYDAVMDIPDGEGTTNAYISAYIMMDYSYQKSQRQVHTFSMVFSDTGGFMTIIFMLTEIFVNRV